MYDSKWSDTLPIPDLPVGALLPPPTPNLTLQGFRFEIAPQQPSDGWVCRSLCGLFIETFIFVLPADGMDKLKQDQIISRCTLEMEEDEQRGLLHLQEEQLRACIDSKASRRRLAWHFGVHSDRCAPLPLLLRVPAEVLCHVLLLVHADATGLALLFWTCKSFALALLSVDAFRGTTASGEQCLHVVRLMNLPILHCLVRLLYGPYQSHAQYRPLVPLRSIPIPRWLHRKLCRSCAWPGLEDVAAMIWRPLLDTLLALHDPPLSQAELTQALDTLHDCICAGMDEGDIYFWTGFDIEADFVPLEEFLDRTRCANSHGGCCMGKAFGLSNTPFRRRHCALRCVTCPLSANVLPEVHLGGEIPEASCLVDPNIREICAKAASITSMQDRCLYLKIMREEEVLLFLLVSIPWTLGEPHAVVYQAVFDVGT